MKTTTLNEIREYSPCPSGWKKLLEFLGKTEADDEQLSFLTILESNGIEDAVWCLRVLPDFDLDVMTFKLKCARRVEHLDKTGAAKKTLDVVEKFIAGNAIKEDLRAAADADAYAATSATYAASAASAAAAYADAADAASASAYAASAASAAAAYADASAKERKYQTQIFKEIFG